MAEEPGKKYVSPQAAVDDLKPGWKVTGPGRPYYQTQPAEGALANEPQTAAKQLGVTYPIQGPNGETDEITLGASESTYVWNTDPNAPLPKALVVVKGPTTQPSTTAPRASPAGELERLDENMQPLPAGSTKQPTFVRDPKAPAGTAPYRVEPSTELGDPSNWTPIYDPNDTSQTNRRVIGYFDPKSQKVAASVPAQAGNRASDPNTWTPVYRTPGDKASGVVGQWDPVNHELHAVSTVDGKQIVTTQNAIYVVDKDTGKAAKVQDIDKSVPYQLANIDGVAYRFDPNEKDITKALVQVGPNAPMPKQITQNGVTWTWNADTNKYELPPGITRPTTMTGAGTTSKYLITYDAVTGEEIGRKDNPNYQAPQAQLPQINATSPYIPAPDPDNPGSWKWVENKGQVLASDALKNLAGILSGQVVDGKMTVDEAKSLIDGANATMTNAISAANTQLDFVSEGARTGAGLLQQRAATAQGIIGNVLGLAGQGQHYGGGAGTAGLSGGMMAAPAGLGGLLTQGAAGYSADLLGGQATMDAAARLVQAADPKSDLFSPASQAAVGTLMQMFDKYHQLNGAPHPAVVAQAAAQQSGQNGGATAPQTYPVFQPQPQNGFQYDPRFTPDQPQQPPGTVLPAGVAGTVAPNDPRYLGFRSPAAFTQSGIPEGTFRGPVTSGQPINVFIGGGG